MFNTGHTSRSRGEDYKQSEAAVLARVLGTSSFLRTSLCGGSSTSISRHCGESRCARHELEPTGLVAMGFAHTLSAMAPQLFVNSLPALYARSPPFTIHPRHKTLALQPLRYLPASPPPPAASAAGQLLAAHPVAASASALGALLAIGAACSYVALSRRLAKLSELDEAAEALDPEYF